MQQRFLPSKRQHSGVACHHQGACQGGYQTLFLCPSSIHRAPSVSFPQMGKLLNKLVHGFVPSWLNRVKSSSAQPSRIKQLLPFSKQSSISASSSSSSSSKNSQQLPSLVPTESARYVAEPCSAPCAYQGAAAVSTEPSLAKQEEAASTSSKSYSSNQNDHHRHHQVSDDAHSLQTSCTHRNTHHRDQQHRGDCNIYGPELDRRPQYCILELALNSNDQGGHSSRPVMADNMDFCNTSNEEAAALHMAKDNFHKDFAKEQSLGAAISHDRYRQGYHDLLGLKRKSQCLLDDGEEEEDEEEEEEEEEERAEEEEEKGSHRSFDIDMTGWGWKRRKGERGLMSCELPESIRCMVGNGRAVVKESLEPDMAVWESMVEMIVGNGLWDNMGSLEFLLFCYLSLNEPHLHPLIQSSFLKVLRDLGKIVS